jgi:hypothetical protein
LKEAIMVDSFREAYRFLSNFYPVSIFYQGREYPSAEHAYQAAKCPAKAEEIIDLRLASEAKAFGSTVPLPPDWDQKKERIMLEILRIKFSNIIMKKRLLATGVRILVEGNSWHDNYWGRCYCGRRKGCDGSGKSRLGVLLMQVRGEIRAEKS